MNPDDLTTPSPHPLPPPDEKLQGLNPRELFGQALHTPAATARAVEWTPPPPQKLAEFLPQYRVEGLIGRGGMGAVYKGLQPALERVVAIKLLPAELSADAGFVARFQREARMLAKMQHPGIVIIHDFGQTSESHLYFVMEFVDGIDLSQIIKCASLTPAQALELTIQICEALQYAHGQGLIHRDVKPANILVTKEGRAKLVDFGLARPVEQESGMLTTSDIVMGTTAYMAPEQREGHADQRADIYALGVVLYEMLTGKRPEGAFEPPSVKVHVDVRLDQVVIKAMQQEPERRYQHASEMKTEVEEIRTTPLQDRASPTAATEALEKKKPQVHQEQLKEKIGAPQNAPGHSRRGIRIGMGAIAAAVFLIGWGTLYLIGQNRQQKELDKLHAAELAKADAALEKQREETAQARKALDDIRDHITLALAGKRDLPPKERYEAALAEVAFANKMETARLSELIEAFSKRVESDSKAEVADRARVAFKNQQYVEAARLGNEAGDDALKQMKVAEQSIKSAETEREKQRRRALENYTLSGQAEYQQTKYESALIAFQKAADLTNQEKDPVEWADAEMWVGCVRGENAEYTPAIALLKQIVPVYEKCLGPDDMKLAKALNNLASFLKATNRLAEGEPLMQRAMKIFEKNYGPEQSDLLTIHAQWLQATNRLAEAEPLMRHALKLAEKSLGPKHPTVAMDLANLAMLLKDTNRLAEAEPLMRRALKIDEKSFGPEHPAVAADLDKLALILHLSNHLEEAITLRQRALKIEEKAHGLEHPKVAVRLGNLAVSLHDANRLAEAEPLIRRALKIDEKSLGPEHPIVAVRLANLGRLLQATNRLAEAEPLIRRALEIDEKSLGPDYPEVAIILNNLASLLLDMNRLAEAEPLSRRAVGILLKFLKNTGHESPYFRDTVTIYELILSDLPLSEEEMNAKLASLGPEVVKAWEEYKAKQITITKVLPDGQGAKIGLKVGDVVMGYAGNPAVSNLEKLVRRMNDTHGDGIDLEIQRGADVVHFKVKGGRIGVQLEKK